MITATIGLVNPHSAWHDDIPPIRGQSITVDDIRESVLYPGWYYLHGQHNRYGPVVISGARFSHIDGEALLCRDCAHTFENRDSHNASLAPDEFNPACPACGSDWVEEVRLGRTR